jgi:hypothetical protein
MTPSEITAWVNKQPYLFYDGLYMYSKRYKLKNKDNFHVLRSIKTCIIDEPNMEFYLKRLCIDPNKPKLFDDESRKNYKGAGYL